MDEQIDEQTHWLVDRDADREIQDSIPDSRLLYLIREIKTWLNINHITVHNNTYCVF